uniref:SET domain-containing protein n=1 Tax=Cyprinus carpio carpio TaxID=630221 RepID=A0A9J7XPJ6_CYPCA
MPPRISPLKDAMHHVVMKSDKTKLEVKYINAVKGRGLFTNGSFSKGDFIVEYRGELINYAELERRRKLYHPSCAVFMFEFKWRGKTWCIDASREDGSFGRLVNDDHQHPNCKMKKIDVNGKAHLCLFALKDIKEGEEITYDYGGDDCPWRTQESSIAANSRAAGDSDPSLQSQTQMDDASGQTKSPQQESSIADNSRAAGDSDPSLQSQTQMDDASLQSQTQMDDASLQSQTQMDDASLQSQTQMDDASLQSQTQMDDASLQSQTQMDDPSLQSQTQMDDASLQSQTQMDDASLQSQTQMDDASGQTKSPQQESSIAANSRAAGDSDPSLQSQTQMDDASLQSQTQMDDASLQSQTQMDDASLQSQTQMDDPSLQSQTQ